jgi:hypothetical protein
VAWRRDGVPMAARKPLLLRALNALYSEKTAEDAEPAENKRIPADSANSAVFSSDRGARVPWLNAPEDSWL